MAVLMAVSALGGLFTLPAAAAAGTTDTSTAEESIDYLKYKFSSPEEKYDTMVTKLTNTNFELRVETTTGEVACKNLTTGEILFTNPYDVATTGTTDAVKSNILSQIIIKYDDNGTIKEMNSYTDAALNGQVTCKDIKGGLRVEYTLGREQTRYLAPRMISKERFETLILANMPETGRTRQQLLARYLEMDPFDESLPESVIANMQQTYPITKKMAVYVFISNAVARDYRIVEDFIKTYCPEYTYEEMEADHMETGYTGTDVAPALFKLALEYSLNSDGMTVRLSANGIRYDETNYSLKEVQILPYVGAGSSDYTGYSFIPDGSGALVRFEDFKGKSVNTAGTIYGQDYAYKTISGTTQETMRLPVYGIVENTVQSDKSVISKGFLAIIEEGEALVSLMSTSGVTTHKYYMITTRFTPRQSDSYSLSDSISTGVSSAALTVESSRKYVGNLKIRFIMLTDPTLAAANGISDYYETSWVGMAKAYREYLEANGTLTRLTSETTKEDLPLYMETFGVLETTERIASIPVTVKKALTTFEDIMTMYQELSAANVGNISFRLTGYTNGGFWPTSYAKLKWEDAAGGAKGFAELVQYAKDNNFGIYPDFDLAYLYTTEAFDGFSFKDHAIKTINNQYSSKLLYYSSLQDYVWDGYCIAPSVYGYFYDKLSAAYDKSNPVSISLSTMGTALNSDFDEKEPYNREDSKAIVSSLLADVADDYENVMLDGGNAYTLSYATDILKVSLDSSRYSLTSEAVPFVGMVLHGYVSFAGDAINMSGDTDYELLKAVENGASLYFILSKQNTQLLKENWSTSQYYSVRYDIWFDELVEKYTCINAAIGDLQTKLIVDHEFIDGYRIPDEEEIAADKADAELTANELAAAAQKALERRGLQYLRSLYEKGEIQAGISEAEKNRILEEYYATIDTTTTTPGETATDNSKYLTASGQIVKVTYEGGVSFIINYTNYEVSVTDDGLAYTLPAYGFVRIDDKGTSKLISNYNVGTIILESDRADAPADAVTIGNAMYLNKPITVTSGNNTQTIPTMQSVTVR